MSERLRDVLLDQDNIDDDRQRLFVYLAERMDWIRVSNVKLNNNVRLDVGKRQKDSSSGTTDRLAISSKCGIRTTLRQMAALQRVVGRLVQTNVGNIAL